MPFIKSDNCLAKPSSSPGNSQTPFRLFKPLKCRDKCRKTPTWANLVFKMNRNEIPGRIHLFVKSSNAKITYFLTGFYFCCIRKNLNFYSRVTQHPVISPCFHKDWKQEEINKIQYHLIVSSFLKNHMDKSHGHWCHEPLREISFVCVCASSKYSRALHCDPEMGNSTSYLKTNCRTVESSVFSHWFFVPDESFLSGRFHKPLILIHQRANRMKTTITEN